MSLTIDIGAKRGDFTLDLQVDAGPGVTVLFGRSGAGKTSAINAVAGLLTPDRGRISIGGRVLFDSAQGINLAVKDRRVGYVFQDARLFPHLSVAQNLCYGGTHNRDQVIALMGLEKLLDRRPATLSGGEKQRVALGRALMCDPQILLLDEPLAALDAARKAEILPYLEGLRDQLHMPILYVSHDITEVARVATTLVIIDDGRALRAGPVAQVLADPGAVAQLGVQDAGAVISARVAGYDGAQGLTDLRFDGGVIRLPGKIGTMGAALRLRVGAGDVILARHAPREISALNVLPVTITGLEQGQGPGVAVGLRCGNTPLLARITKASAHAMGLAPGQDLFAIIKANAIAPSDISATTALDKHAAGL